MDERSTVQVNAWGTVFHAGYALECLLTLFRIRCHPFQAKMLERYGLGKHQIIAQQDFPRDILVLENPTSGAEFGRIINLYVPN